MPSLLPGFEYDVFISYRQNDNRSGWVTQFVEDLREELAATLKEPVNIYFDENPHDGLQDTHHVDKSLEGKLRCLVFLPILSHTYCDEKSFAWTSEFIPFCSLSGKDHYGMDVRLSNGNYASRILPVQIHELSVNDQGLFRKVSGSPLRSIDFVFTSPGVNRPLTREDTRAENLGKTIYRDQVNKTANAIEMILHAMTPGQLSHVAAAERVTVAGSGPTNASLRGFWDKVQNRNVLRAGAAYIVIGILLVQAAAVLTPVLRLEDSTLRFIWQVIAFGLPVALILAWYFERSPQGFILTTSPASKNNPLPPHQKKPLTNVAMIVILAVSVGLLYLYGTLIAEESDGATTDQPAAVAILPFENQTGIAKDQYLANAIADDIIDRMSTLPELRVTSRRSTQQYQGNLLTAYRQVASELKVKYLLTGGLQRSNNEIIVHAELVDGRDNSYLWGDTFRGTNYKKIPGHIALAVAKRLDLDLSELEVYQLTLLPTSNDTAYFRYQLGRSLYYKYRRTAYDSAVVQFKLALDADPRYALAWAGLGDAYGQLGLSTSLHSWYDSALNAGNKAIQLDSNLSEGYKAVALVYMYQRLYDKAMPLLEKAVSLSASNAQAVGNLGTAHMLKGNLVEALELEKRSAGLTPKNWIPYQLMGWIYGLLGDRERALESLGKSLELNPYDQTYELLGYNYVAMGRKQDALNLIPQMPGLKKDDFKALERAGLIAHFAGDADKASDYFRRSIDNNKNFATDANAAAAIGLGQILLQKGKRVEADVLLTHVLEVNENEVNRGSQDDDPPFRIAAVHAILGHKEEMLSWMQKAIASNWTDLVQAQYGPWFAAYRSDPAFQTLLQPTKTRLSEMKSRLR